MKQTKKSLLSSQTAPFVGAVLFFCVGLFSATLTAAPEPTLQPVHGVLTANTQAVFSSQLTGYVLKLPVEEGQSFKKGDDLVVFDCTIHEAELKKSQAKLKATQAAFRANTRLAKMKAVSKVELAESEAAYQEAQANRTINAHTVTLCNVKAPFDGKVVKRAIHPFESVRQGDKLIEVLDNTSLRLDLIVPSEWLTWLSEGYPFQLTIKETGKTYQANVKAILPNVDAVSRSIQLVAKVDSKTGELFAGMSGEASFAPPEKKAAE